MTIDSGTMITIKKMNPDQQQQQQQQRGRFSSLFENITINIHSRLTRIRRRRRRRRSPLCFFPLPEPQPPYLKNTPVVREIFEHTLLNMHDIHESLHFWKAKACQRNGGDEISQTISVLGTIQKDLAIFLSKLFKELELPDSSLPKLLHSLNALFLELQDSVCHINDLICCRLSFEVLGPDNNNAPHLIHSNLNTLDIYLSLVIDKYQKPNTIIQHWKGYTIGAIGISLFSVWILRHTSVPHIIRNWLLQADESITNFSIFHVEEPLTTIDELFHKKQKNEIELEQLQSTFDFYYSQFAYFARRNERQRFLAKGYTEGIREWLKAIIEKQFRDPSREIFMEEHAFSMLEQIRKQKFDIKMEIHQLNEQLLSPNEKKVTLSADLPIVVLSFGAVMIFLWVAKGVTEFTVAESKGWIARKQIRLLIREVTEKIAQFNMCDILSTLQNEEFHYKHGLLLYTLDRLYKVLKFEAELTVEWPWLEEEVSFLGKTDVRHMTDKLNLLSCMKKQYDSNWFLRRRYLSL